MTKRTIDTTPDQVDANLMTEYTHDSMYRDAAIIFDIDNDMYDCIISDWLQYNRSLHMDKQLNPEAE